MRSGRVFVVVRGTLLLQRVGPRERLRFAGIEGPLGVPDSRKIRFAVRGARRGSGWRRMRRDLRDSEFPAVAQGVQLEIEEVDIEAQSLGRQDRYALDVGVEPRRGDRQLVGAGR